jgi:ribosomal protein L40E
MRRLVIIVSLGIAVFAAGLALTAPGTEGVSPDLLPRGELAITGVHESHPANRPACAACHPNAAGSRWASERLVPRMERCASCHEEARGVTSATPVEDKCRKCHKQLKDGQRPVPGILPRPNVRFPHAAHKQVDCAGCHPLAAQGRSADRGRDIVGMEVCYRCHQQEPKASTECRACHLVHGDGRMVTRIGSSLLTPPSWLKGPSHGPTWSQSHAAQAGADSRFCGACHRESYCQGCHSGRLRPRDAHPGDWIASHGVTTRIDNPRCRSCHRKQSFCITCHRRQGVAPDSPSNTRQIGQGRFHGTMSVEQICRRARHDITACASCHSESSCISCHTAINPHPAGWQRRCKPLVRRNGKACAKCHAGDVTNRCL